MKHKITKTGWFTLKMTVVLTTIVSVIAVMLLCLTPREQVFADTTSSPQNPTKLFSLNIGTSTTTDSGPNIGVLIDERTTPTYKRFYLPASFVVDKDSNMVAVLDSIRNRVAVFSMTGQYRGEIKLPFNIPAIDFAWFPKTDTMIFIFQNSPDVGVLSINTANGFSIKSSSAFVVPQASSNKTMGGGFMNIWPINTLNGTNNYFVLNTLDQSSSTVLVQASSSVTRVQNIDENIKGIIGVQNKTAIAGYDGDGGTTLLAQDLDTNQISRIDVSTSTSGISMEVGGSKLASLSLVGTDENGDFYIDATYPSDTTSDTIGMSGASIVYKIDPNGLVVGKVDIFTSPQMLTNRFLFVDSYGSVFYMRADDQHTISFYEYDISTPPVSVSTTNDQRIPSTISSFLPSSSSLVLYGGSVAVLIALIALILVVMHLRKRKKAKTTIGMPSLPVPPPLNILSSPTSPIQPPQNIPIPPNPQS